MKTKINKQLLFLVAIFIALLSMFNTSYAQLNEDCMMCHEDQELTAERNGLEVSMFVDIGKLSKSVHADADCIMCHEDAAVEDFPHNDNLMPVNCGNCHMDSEMQFNRGIHGQVLKQNAPYAPNCKDCHGSHDILPGYNVDSRTYKMNIPVLCGACHKEDGQANIQDHLKEVNAFSDYSLVLTVRD